MRVFATVLLVFLALSARAADRTEMIRILMESQGLLATFERQMELGRENCKRQAGQMIDQALVSLESSPELKAKMQDAAKKFIDAAQPQYTAQDLVDEWSALYGPRFTDEELEQLVAFYSSPLAQKEVATSRELLAPFYAHFQEIYKPHLEQATKDYVANLQSIIKTCNCVKKKPEGV